MMEKRINDKLNPLTIDEIRADLNLCFEKLKMILSDEDEKNCTNDGNLQNGTYCTYHQRSGHLKRNCFKLKKKITEITVHPVS